MAMDRYGEFNLLRVRGHQFSFGSSVGYTWDIERDGSFLRLAAGASGPWTVTLVASIPASPMPPTGMRLWVEFYQGGSGSSLITWPGNFLFQTVGDAVPGPGMGITTIWTGIFGVSSTNCFMTKLGEW